MRIIHMEEQRIEIILDKPIAKEDVQEVAYWLNFASNDIVRFVIDSVERRNLQVWALPDASAKTVEEKVRATIARFSNSSSKPEVSERRPIRVGKVSTKTVVKPGPDEAVKAAIMSPLGLADIEVRGILVALIRGFDNVFRKMGTQLGAEERAYSTFLPMDFLEHCHYFDAFPQNIMYPAMMQTDIDAANEFTEKTLANHGCPPSNFDGFADRTHVLAPAACFHVYLANEDKILSENTTITTMGRCYRYEGHNATMLERLWDFQMREIVFLGEKSFVEKSRKVTLDKVFQLLDEWQLSGTLKPGHDPFFLRGDIPDCELVDDPKYELRLDLPYRSGDFSCASFNNSGTFFSKTSDITLADGSPAWTGCTAFGLERWAWAVIAQHGTNPEVWPESLQNLLEE